MDKIKDLRLFALRINNNVGSFAPIELLDKTIKEINETITKVKEKENKTEDDLQLLKELEQIEYIGVSVKSFVKLSKENIEYLTQGVNKK